MRAWYAARQVDDFFEKGRGTNAPWAEVQMFQTRIRRNIRLAEAPSFGQSIFQYAGDSNGADDYRRLSAEILGISAENELREPAELVAQTG